MKKQIFYALSLFLMWSMSPQAQEQTTFGRGASAAEAAVMKDSAGEKETDKVAEQVVEPEAKPERKPLPPEIEQLEGDMMYVEGAPS